MSFSAANWASASDAKSSGVTTLSTVSRRMTVRALGKMAARQYPGLRKYVTIENSETLAMIASEDRLAPAMLRCQWLLPVPGLLARASDRCGGRISH